MRRFKKAIPDFDFSWKSDLRFERMTDILTLFRVRESEFSTFKQNVNIKESHLHGDDAVLLEFSICHEHRCILHDFITFSKNVVISAIFSLGKHLKISKHGAQKTNVNISVN